MKDLRSHRTKKSKKGFALISTVVILSLLTLVTLGLISLSVQESKLSSSRKFESIAKANARLALQIAVSKLQKSAGPDQRITATASILENPSSTSPIPNPHWVAVWRSDGLLNDPTPNTQPLIHRSEDSSGTKVGSLIDRRADSSYDPQTQVLEWLVSSSSTANPLNSIPSDKKITLVGPGSSNDSDDYVSAEKITITTAGIESGAYAYWVGDEGVKARFDLKKSSTTTPPTFITTAPEQTGPDILPGFENYETLPSDNFEKILTRNTTDISGISSLDPARTARKNHFHDLTFDSLSVLSDTRQGKLKRNLTAFFKSTGDVPGLPNRPGLKDEQPLLDHPKLDLVSPRFGLLRKWAQIANSSTSSGINIITPKNIANGTSWGWNLNFQSPASGIDMSQQDTPPIHPVVLDAGISYGVSLEKIGPSNSGIGTYRINIHYFPRVVLWNPYNAKLNPEKYVIQINMPHSFDVRLTVPGQSQQNLPFLNAFHQQYGGENLPHRPHFSIPSTSFEPGEALLFTADAGGSVNGNKYWGEPNTATSASLSHFSLSCTQPAPLNGNFYYRTTTNVQIPDTSIKNAAYQVFARKNGNNSLGYKLYFYKLYHHKGSGNSVEAVRTDPSGFPLIQFITQTEDGSSGSDAPWFVSIPPTASAPLRELSRPVTAFYRFKWGHRMQWIQDTIENQTIKAGPYEAPYLGYNTIANHNLRAGWHHRSPVEVALRAGATGGRYTHGIAIDDPYGWDWNDPSYYPVPVNGKNRVSPFGRPASYSGQTFPLLDIPKQDTPLVSLGSLQHAPISQFVWHPTYAIANSLADPRVPRDQSSNHFSRSEWAQVGIHSQKDWTRVRQAHIDDKLNDQTNLYDLSYEANHALLDKFFLAPLPSDPSFKIGDPLPNPRLTTINKPTIADLKDYHQAAQHFMIKGAFNINSTSEPAWAALIASFRDNPEFEITLEDGSKINANDVYSRLLKPYDEKYENQSDSHPATWKGYRKLNDQQILELAKEIVIEVKQRGPFISLSDFVNRRLIAPPASSGSETEITKTGLKGTLQAAIDRTSINTTLLNSNPIPKTEYNMRASTTDQVRYGSSYPDPTFPVKSGHPAYGPKPDHNHWADSKLVGSPAFLTQADILQKLAPVLTARSDTFTIRAYGEAKDPSGRIVSRAWCEAIVQRTPEPISPDETGLDPSDLSTSPTANLGRKFIVTSFRWLNENEI